MPWAQYGNCVCTCKVSANSDGDWSERDGLKASSARCLPLELPWKRLSSKRITIRRSSVLDCCSEIHVHHLSLATNNAIVNKINQPPNSKLAKALKMDFLSLTQGKTQRQRRLGRPMPNNAMLLVRILTRQQTETARNAKHTRY